MRIVAIAVYLASLLILPASAQQVLQDFSYLTDRCPPDTVAIRVNAAPQSALYICKKYYDIESSPGLRNTLNSINTLEGKVSDLTAKNELLENNLKTLTEALDALTARLNKADGK